MNVCCEWWKLGGGGTVWDAIVYDPELDLLYVGTGNGGPWNQNLRSPGGGDNLFLASIVAPTAARSRPPAGSFSRAAASARSSRTTRRPASGSGRSRRTFDAIVLGGARAANGMVSFASQLTPADAQAVRAYVITLAIEQKSLEDSAAARAARRRRTRRAPPRNLRRTQSSLAPRSSAAKPSASPCAATPR